MRWLLLVFFSTLSPLVARDYVTIVGSSSVYPFMTAIVEKFYREEQQPAPIVESTGTGGGIIAFCAGTGDNQPDIVVASRPMTLAEKKYCEKHDMVSPVEFELGLDAVVLVTLETPFSITLDELRQALTLPVSQWHDINSKLPRKPVSIIGPAVTSGVFDTLSTVVLKPYHLTLRGDKAYTEVIGHERVVVKKLELSPEKLGLLSFTFLDYLDPHFKPLTINGIAPTAITISTGQYALSRKSYLYVKPHRLSQVKSLAPFLRYVFNSGAIGSHGFLLKYGFIPLPEKSYIEQRDKMIRLLQNQKTGLQ
jgi:phosphate transport system substrate-binding protein